MSELKVFLVVTFLAFYCLAKLSAKLVPIYNEHFEDCDGIENKFGRFFEFSNLEIVYESENNQLMNGTVVFNTEILTWPLTVYFKKYSSGEWQKYGPTIKRENFCAEIHNPLEIWYKVFKDAQGCPINKDVKISLDLTQSL